MPEKVYSPVASYTALKQVEIKIESAQTIDEIREILASDGAKIGYKAFCFILMRKLTPEAMKPDEAAVAAFKLQQENHYEAALEILRRILAVHPGHPLAIQQLNSGKDDIPNWIVGS